MINIDWSLVIKNKYNHLLTILVIIFIACPFLQNVDTHFPIIAFLFLAAIIPALNATLNKIHFYSMVSLALLAFFMQLLSDYQWISDSNKVIFIITISIYALFVIISILILMRKMMSITVVTPDTIKGGICIYLLMAFLWTLFYIISSHFDPMAFSTKNVTFMYFSLTTLTTLGYGDISPTNDYTMVLATLEACVGQIYLAVFIARLVGLHIVHQFKQ